MELLQILITVTLLHSVPIVVLLPKTYSSINDDCSRAVDKLSVRKIKKINMKMKLQCVTVKTLYI